ncbi:MAG: hypothetical protein JNM56_29200 [Planctomycetia bacterium]|nr:hypothetical protein [Planctomycetia bacterium]
MIPNPIRKVLFTLQMRQVQYLLMGGQACVLYGAAEFSRDTDIALLAEPGNLDCLRQALEDLQAECIAVPPFQLEYLQRGHAVHFRCRQSDAAGMRLDVLAKMRGVAPFAELWEGRLTVEVEPGVMVEVLSLPDLVQAKKTQRDKHWPMIRRLLEAHYARCRDEPNSERINFWLREMRTEALLLELAERYPVELAGLCSIRPLLALASGAQLSELTIALQAEEQRERAADRQYWQPLRVELEQLRRRKPQP